MACGKCNDVIETATQPFTEACVQYFWKKLRDPPSGYKIALDESVLYRVFYCLPGKSSHASLIFSDDGVNGFTIELFVKQVPELEGNVTNPRVCLRSKWFKKDARWVPIPEIGINASRHNIYLYAIAFMKKFGTQYSKKDHSCQDFILWFLHSVGISKPFRTLMGKLKLAAKIALSPALALVGVFSGVGFLMYSPIIVPVALWNNMNKPDPLKKVKLLIVSPLGVLLMPTALVYESLLEETPKELEQNRQYANSVGINLVELQSVPKYKKFFNDICCAVNQNSDTFLNLTRTRT